MIVPVMLDNAPPRSPCPPLLVFICLLHFLYELWFVCLFVDPSHFSHSIRHTTSYHILHQAIVSNARSNDNKREIFVHSSPWIPGVVRTDLHEFNSLAWRPKGLIGYCFKYIDRLFCLWTNEFLLRGNILLILQYFDISFKSWNLYTYHS